MSYLVMNPVKNPLTDSLYSEDDSPGHAVPGSSDIIITESGIDIITENGQVLITEG